MTYINATARQRQTRVAALKADGLQNREIIPIIKAEFEVADSYDGSKVARDYHAFERYNVVAIQETRNEHLERRLTVLADDQQYMLVTMQEALSERFIVTATIDDLVKLSDAIVRAGKALRELRGLDAPRTLNIRHLIEARVRLLAEEEGVDPIRLLERVETRLIGA